MLINFSAILENVIESFVKTKPICSVNEKYKIFSTNILSLKIVGINVRSKKMGDVMVDADI